MTPSWRTSAPPLGRDARRAALMAIAVGTLMRLIWTLRTGGLPFDMHSVGMAADALLHRPLHLYSALNPPHEYHWPYPPGYFPWVLASHGLASAGVISFRVAVVLPAIAADALLAWLVQVGLGRAGADDRARLGGCALVALGPAFALISGFHGQIDSVAILPAVAALLVWDGRPRRALGAGLLIGVAASIKTAPGLVLLALLPSVRSRREALTLCTAAVAVPLVALAPFLAADASGVVRALRYAGIPGEGGLSMLADPNLVRHFVFDAPVTHVTAPIRLMVDHGALLTGAALAAVGAVVARRRMPARDGAAVLWLTLYVAGTAFAFQYAVWGLPFLILAGRLRWALWMQAGLLVPEALYYLGPWHGPEVLIPVYVACMGAVWLGQAAALRASLLGARRRVLPGVAQTG